MQQQMAQLQQQMAQLQQQVSKSSGPTLHARFPASPAGLSTEAGTPVLAASAWANGPALMEPAPAAQQQLQQTVPREDHQPAQHSITAATPQQSENTTSAPTTEPMTQAPKLKPKPTASRELRAVVRASGAVKVPLPENSSTHFFIRLVNLCLCLLVV